MVARSNAINGRAVNNTIKPWLDRRSWVVAAGTGRLLFLLFVPRPCAFRAKLHETIRGSTRGFSVFGKIAELRTVRRIVWKKHFGLTQIHTAILARAKNREKSARDINHKPCFGIPSVRSGFWLVQLHDEIQRVDRLNPASPAALREHA